MRIVVVSPYFPPALNMGGWTRSVWNLSRGLVRAGAQVHVVTTDAGATGSVPESRVDDGVAISTLLAWPRVGGRRFAFAPRLAGKLAEAVADAELCVLQGTWTFPLAVAARICRRRGLAYILSLHGTLEEQSLAEKAWKKRIYWHLVESTTVRDALAVHFGSERERSRSMAAIGETASFVVPNVTEIPHRIHADREELRGRLRLPVDRTVIGISGRIHPRKGLDVLVDAMADCDPTIHLASFGADEEGYLKGILRRARARGVRDRLHILGHLDGPALQAAYAAVDLLVMPSRGESFGNVVIEALAHGTEVMVSEHVPVGEWVVAHGLGSVVAPLDPPRWAAALNRWLERRSYFDRRRAVALVAREFDFAPIGKQFLREAESLLQATSVLSPG